MNIKENMRKLFENEPLFAYDGRVISFVNRRSEAIELQSVSDSVAAMKLPNWDKMANSSYEPPLKASDHWDLARRNKIQKKF